MCSHRRTHSESQGQHGAHAPSHTPPKPGLPLPQSPPATPAHHPHPPTPPRTLTPGSLVNADLFHLGDQHLEQPHDGLEWQF